MVRSPMSGATVRRSLVALAALASLLVLPVRPAGSAAADGAGEDNGIGFSGKPGDRLPPDVILRDDTGATVRLRDLADRPLLLTFVPFSCGRQCPLVLGGLAEALGRLRLRPGADYLVATVSIDENDTPETAAAAKRNYLKAIGPGFPPAAWTFLAGDRGAIERLAQAIGLRFQRRQGGHFFHPEVLLAVAPGGTISSALPVERLRYDSRQSVTFAPTEIEQALDAARRGEVRDGRPPEPLYCLPYERAPERAFYRLLRLFGVVNLVLLGAAAVWLLAGGRRSRIAGPGNPPASPLAKGGDQP
ncbi:MAG TPA: SCO family protein [bacterium]